MPIDSNIALQVQQPADPLERYGKVLALKNAIQQGQSGQLQLQQQQTDFDDQQKLKQAYSDAGGDLLKTQENAMKLGVSPKLIINLKSSVLQQAKDMADLDEKKYTALKSKNEIVGGKINAVLSAPPEQQPTAYQAARAELIQQGLIDPAHAPEQFPGAPALNEMFMQTRTGSQMLDIADKLREAKFKEREVATQETNAKTNQGRETRESDQVAFQNAISDLAGNPAANQAEYNARIAKLTPAVASRILQSVPVGQYDPAKSPAALRQISMSGEQQTQAAQAATNSAETLRHDKQTEATATAAHALEAKKFAAQFGGDAVKGWAASIADNPDAAGSVPANLRSSVQQEFTKTTGLPFPKPLTGSALDQERAARNALDGIDFINQALKNPEIQSRLGPIMGRLGNAEQDFGSTAGLSPEAAKLAQELRTRMRYFVFQEGKAVLGGRLPQKLMDALESSSANVHMDAPTLAGAIQGAKDNALSVMDNSDKQRFGGKMRPREQRGITDNSQFKVGDVVNIGGKKVKIKVIHTDGTFDGDPQ